MTAHGWSTALAFGLDAWLGDPRWLPHPVRGIGVLIGKLEKWLYPLPWRRAAGVVLLLGTVAVTGVAALLLWRMGNWLGPTGRMVWEAMLIWPALALRDLVEHSRAVANALRAGDLAGAREKLARMVSRETGTADRTAVARGCIESVAENLVDGEISPLVFALLGGPVAVWMYKAVSTLDSMVGYRNERYLHFGWASARADDGLNYVPARLCCGLLPAAAAALGMDGRQSWRTMLREGDRNPSPNSGIPEAGVAGALGIELGGANVYEGRVMEKPRLNAGARAARVEDIARAQRLVVLASVLLLAGWLLFKVLLMKEMW